ncbi:hypothetical protein BFF94_010665 [Burkholderia catarinensis]|nr:hypothetical protein BFF94_010665 [Burkholderia catarinensis]
MNRTLRADGPACRAARARCASVRFAARPRRRRARVRGRQRARRPVILHHAGTSCPLRHPRARCRAAGSQSARSRYRSRCS